MAKSKALGERKMNFKEFLKRKDLTASQLARRLGVSVAVVWKWTNNRSEPKAAYISQIAKVLNVPVEQVLACFTKDADGEHKGEAV